MIFVPQVRLTAPGTTAPQTGAAEIVQPKQEDYGRQLQQLASVAGSVGVRMTGMGERAIRQANVAVARKKVGLAREKLAKILDGQGDENGQGKGYLYSIGEEALDQRTSAMQAVEDAMSAFDAEGVFDNDVQREMFKQAIQADVLRSRAAINAHGEKQARVMDIATAKVEYEHQTRQIARYGWSADNEAVLRQNVEDHRAATGEPKAVARARFETQLSAGMSTYINDLIDADDFDGAQAALDAAYDKEDKDGNKRDKLIGGARGDLTNKLQSARDMVSKRDETNAKTAARQASIAQGREDATRRFSSYLAEGLSPQDAYSKTLSDLTQLIRPGGLDGKGVTPEAWDIFTAGVSALEAFGRNGLNQQRTQELDAADQAETFVDQLLESGSDMTADQMEQALQEEMGEGFGLLTPKQRQKLRLRQQATRSSVKKAEQDREEALAQARGDALLHPTMTPDAVFMLKYPYTEEGELQFREDTQDLPKSMAKEMVTRREQLFKRPVTDQAFAGERQQILDYLETQPWAAQRDESGKLRKRPDGTYQVDRAFSEHIAGLWSAAQQGLGLSGTKEEFNKWLQENFSSMTPDMMAQHAFREEGQENHYVPRQMLPAFGAAVSKRNLQRTTRYGDTYRYGQIKQTPQQDPQGSGNNVLDLILHYERSKPLVGKRQYKPMTGSEMAQAEAIFASLPPKLRTYEALKELGPGGFGALRMSERPTTPEYAESQASPAVRIMHRNGTLYEKTAEQRASILKNRAAVAVTTELSPSAQEMQDKEYMQKIFAPAVNEKYQQFELEAKRLLDSQGYDEMIKKEKREARMEAAARGDQGSEAAVFDMLVLAFEWIFGGSEDEK